MDQVRLILAITLSLIIFIVWAQLFGPRPDVRQQDKPIGDVQEETVKEETTVVQEEPDIFKDAAPLPEIKQTSERQPRTISVDTPYYTAEISEKGAAFKSVVLKNYNECMERNSRPKELIDPAIAITEKGKNTVEIGTTSLSGDELTILRRLKQTSGYYRIEDIKNQLKTDIPDDLVESMERKGLIITRYNRGQGTVLVGLSESTSEDIENAVFQTGCETESLSVEKEQQTIDFSYKTAEGIVVRKRFTFFPDTYRIKMDVLLQNMSDKTIQDNVILSLINPNNESVSRISFEGPCGLMGNRLEEVDVKKLDKQNVFNGMLKWIAVQDRYFITSIIPENETESAMRITMNSDNILKTQYITPKNTIGPNTEKAYGFSLYFGPKSVDILKDLNRELDKAVNFGWFDFLAKPCLWLMNRLYIFIPNYGVAIIILTLLIKIVLWPLGTKSYKSMNEMKKLQPLMADIREKHKDDKKKMNEELMGLYKTYKINPLGGCLPMVAQIPVFFALYKMLYGAVELRHAPFVGWINDLSAPDRLFDFGFSIPFMHPPYGIPVLTVIMGATMFLQQKLSPPPGDPMQAKMMMFMPLIFTIIFINFSSGLVLYWLVNNVLSISQQYYISKKYA